jgi:hypothetical protein
LGESLASVQALEEAGLLQQELELVVVDEQELY